MARRRYRKVTSGSGKSHQGRRITMAQQQASSRQEEAAASSRQEEAAASSSKQQARRSSSKQQQGAATAGKHQASTRQAARILEGRRNIMLASICWEKIIKHVHTPCRSPVHLPGVVIPMQRVGVSIVFRQHARGAAGEQQQVSSSR